jgi:hypothetical protein
MRSIVKKFNLININTGFTDAKVILSPEKYLDVHMAVLSRFDYFKMVYERNNFQSLPIEKRIFSFPEYAEPVIKNVIELIYYNDPVVENVETYREIRKLSDFLNLLKDDIINQYIIKYTKKFKCEWELYELSGRQNIDIIIDKKREAYKMINEPCCTEIVCIQDNNEFLAEIDKLLTFKISLISARNKLLVTINIILAVRCMLFHTTFHGIYHSIISYIYSRIQIIRRNNSELKMSHSLIKICSCSTCNKHEFYIPDSIDGMDLFKNILINSTFKLEINNDFKLNDYISSLTNPKSIGKKKIPRKNEEDEEDEQEEEIEEGYHHQEEDTEEDDN